MILTIQLFARAKELANANAVTLEFADGATVGELRAKLAVQVPSLASLLRTSAIAVNHEFAEDSCVLQVADEIAIIPPVSGG